MKDGGAVGQRGGRRRPPGSRYRAAASRLMLADCSKGRRRVRRRWKRYWRATRGAKRRKDEIFDVSFWNAGALVAKAAARASKGGAASRR